MAQTVDIKLTWGEINMAGNSAVATRIISMKSGRSDDIGLEDPTDKSLGVDRDFQGFMGEIAVSKLLGTYWKPHVVGAVDAGRAEVRSVNHNGKRLMVKEKDLDDAPFVSALVTRELLPVVRLRGFYMGRDAKRKDWWEDLKKSGNWAYYVPNGSLRPMDEIDAALLPRETMIDGDQAVS